WFVEPTHIPVPAHSKELRATMRNLRHSECRTLARPLGSRGRSSPDRWDALGTVAQRSHACIPPTPPLSRDHIPETGSPDRRQEYPIPSADVSDSKTGRAIRCVLVSPHAFSTSCRRLRVV